MSKHGTPATSHSRINGHADTGRVFYPGGEYVLVVDSDGKYFASADTMAEAIGFGQVLGSDLGAYIQVDVPIGVSVVDFAHNAGY